MRLQRIDADAQDFRFLGAKLSRHLAESRHFRWADKGKIRRIKEEDQPFPRMGFQGILSGAALINASQCEVWSLDANDNHGFPFLSFAESSLWGAKEQERSGAMNELRRNGLDRRQGKFCQRE